MMAKAYEIKEGPCRDETSSEIAAMLLREAADLVEGARAEDYGDFLDNINYIAGKSNTTAGQAMDMLINLKGARLRFNPGHHDSAVDKVAYTALACAAKQIISKR